MSARGNTSGKQEQASLLLASGQRIKSVAETVGVAERTVRRWLEDPDFASQVRSHRQETLARASGR